MRPEIQSLANKYMWYDNPIITGQRLDGTLITVQDHYRSTQVEPLVESTPSATYVDPMKDYEELLARQEDVQRHIRECEGKHTQQAKHPFIAFLLGSSD